ncbi:hypothetical protein BDZ90DRAFT_33390 [Jaminaea rosea]|uniref:Uncharacterized protein n=1 Tax=Jaminaea rosea TaxID=1569628 RepID=A0A316V0J4_9BASI|nr:hypothetical protein BDZ90DRAFT_33390 [Jaminaea rosea]PWN31070.1 hypothetical protein BDZ90DRAFT_33390 [Jaminaea rosea]
MPSVDTIMDASAEGAFKSPPPAASDALWEAAERLQPSAVKHRPKLALSELEVNKSITPPRLAAPRRSAPRLLACRLLRSSLYQQHLAAHTVPSVDPLRNAAAELAFSSPPPPILGALAPSDALWAAARRCEPDAVKQLMDGMEPIRAEMKLCADASKTTRGPSTTSSTSGRSPSSRAPSSRLGRPTRLRAGAGSRSLSAKSPALLTRSPCSFALAAGVEGDR